SDRYELCPQLVESALPSPCPPSVLMELRSTSKCLVLLLFLHAGALLFLGKKKGGEVSPAALIVGVDVLLTGAAAARSAGFGWPVPARTPRSTGGSTAPGCSPLPRWCRPASGSTSRSAAR